MTTPTLDHLDAAFTADPYATWRDLRAAGPVWYWPELDSHMVLDHTIARDVLRDSHTFTLDRKAWEHHDPAADTDDRPLLALTFGSGLFQAAPEDHARLRKLVVPHFTPGAIERRRPLVEAIVEEATAEWQVGDAVDLAAEVANVVPVRIISRMLGVDPSREAWFGTVAADIASLATPTAPPEALDRAEEQLGHLRDLLATPNPGGLAAELLAVQDDGDRLSPDESFSLVTALLSAGMETTASAISLGAMSLLANPDQAALLRAEPERWPTAVIELLRHSYIGYGLTRFTTREVTVGGHDLRRGQLLWVNLGAAMHDPVAHPDPTALDITRTAAESFPFGFGPHYCLGAALAKLQIEVTLRHVVERFPDARAAGDPSWRLHFLLRGPTSVPIRL